MPRLPISLTALLGLMLALQAGPAAATIVSGQVDDFEDDLLQGWFGGGAASPNPPTNIATGGPAGADDNFLRLTSNGSPSGPGGRLVVFNEVQWAGNYLAAGVSSIQMQVKNLGSTVLVLRLILDDSADGQSLTTDPITLAAGSDWSPISFSLAAANLSGGSFDTVMGNVIGLNLVHSPDVIAHRSFAPGIVAQLGVDNIKAMSFPGDANGDHVVDFTDLGILLNNYDQPGTFATGDFDHTGIVNFTDLGILLNNYNQHAPVFSPAAAVPEPSSLLLAVAGIAALSFRTVRCRTSPRKR